MTSNRIEPAESNRRKSLLDATKKFLVPETVSESFEWVASGGRTAKTSDIPVHLGIQAIFALSLIILPYYLFKYFYSSESGDDIICNDMSAAFDHFDLMRVSQIFGMGWFSYIFSLVIFHFLVRLIKMSRNRNRNIPSSAQKTMDIINFMAPYLSLSCGVIAMGIMIKKLYPHSMDISTLINTKTQSNSEENIQKIDDFFTLFVKIMDIILSLGVNEKAINMKNMIPIIVNTLSILVLVLTLEKFILQTIAVNYRSATTAGRFTENAFSLSVLKELFRTKLDPSLSSKKLGREFDLKVTNCLFDVLANREGESEGDILKLEHFEKLMNQEQAAKIFGILDVAQNGDLTKEEFASSVKSVYDEQETLSKLLNDHDDIISKIDEIMLIIVYSIDVALCLAFLGIPGIEMFIAIFGFIVAFGFFFQDAFTKGLDSLVLVLITHPYDLGDRVEIDGKYMYVETVGLWTTTFIGPGGLKTIMTNASLADKKIANFRRSPAENEVFSYLVRPETVTKESIKYLKEDCMQFFKENKRDFLPNWHLETYDQIDLERFKIIVKIFHRHNFQNEEAKNERSQKFALFFKDALIRNGFLFSPAYPKAIMAPL